MNWSVRNLKSEDLAASILTPICPLPMVFMAAIRLLSGLVMAYIQNMLMIRARTRNTASRVMIMTFN